jgi:hypothetical protein
MKNFRTTIFAKFCSLSYLILFLVGNLTTSNSFAQTPFTQPVKVFIIAGQSNAMGDGIVQGGRDRTTGNLQHLLANDPRGNYQFLKDAQGDWVERDDVWVTNLGKGNVQTGNLRVNYVTDVTRERVGPELGFGHVMGAHLDNPILLMKLGYGGATLYNDFLSPSSGASVDPSSGSNLCTRQSFSPGNTMTGSCYQEILNQVNNLTGNIAGYMDGRPAAAGYEIAGFVWIQGLTDRGTVNRSIGYGETMKNFISDLRSDLGVPNLPFVIATPGMPCCGSAGPSYTHYSYVELGQLNTPNVTNNVSVVDMRGGYQGVTFNPDPAQSPNDSWGWHYHQNAKTYVDMGLALAHAFIGDPARPLYPSGAAVQPQLATDIVDTTAFNNNSVPDTGNSYTQNFTLGWEFSTDREITISQLGMRDDNKDGVLNGTKPVRVAIFKTLGDGGDILAETYIPVNRSASGDGVVYSDAFPTSLVLPAGTYVVGAQTEAGGETYRQLPAGTAVEFSPGVTFLRELANPGTSFQHPDNWSSNGPLGWFGPTFGYIPGPPPLTPAVEPTGSSSLDQTGLQSLPTAQAFQLHYSLGWSFSVDRTIIINQLGVLDGAAPGHVLNGALDGPDVRVGIFDGAAGGSLRCSAKIPSGRRAAADGVIYAQVDETCELPAGDYAVAALTYANGEPYRQVNLGGTSIQSLMGDGISFTAALANPLENRETQTTEISTFPHPSGAHNGGVNGWFGPTFTYTNAGGPSGGEPDGTSALAQASLQGLPSSQAFRLHYSLGWSFSTDKEIVINQLGVIDSAADGHVINGRLDGPAAQVGIFDGAAGGSLRCSAKIPAGTSASSDGVMYASVNGTCQLPAGDYAVAALTYANGEPYRQVNLGSTNIQSLMGDGISFTAALANPLENRETQTTEISTFPHPSGAHNGGANGWFGPTFTYTIGGDVTPPTGGGTAAVDNLALPNGVGEVGYSLNFALGWQFSTAEEITLTHLGMRDEYTFDGSGNQTTAAPNGVLDGSTDVKLGLWEPGANGALLAQATVPAGTTNIEAGVFYAALSTPLTLSPGSYVVSAMTTTGGEYYRSYPAGVAVPMAPGITFEQALADPDGTNNGAFRHPSGEFNGSVGGGAAWFGPTFKFTTGDDVPPPTGGGTAAVDNLALPNGVGEVGYSLNFALGWQFSTAEEITLTHLGMRDEYTFDGSGNQTTAAPNGVLDGSTDVKLGLWEPGANGALLAQATVPAGTTTIEAGVFYAALSTPLTLSPGSYVVSAMTTTGGEYYRSYPAGVAVPMAPGITFEQALADPDGTNNGAFRHPSGEFNGSVGGGAAWFGPTFKFTTGDGGTPPTGGGTAAVDNLALPNGVGEVGYSLNFALGWQFSTAEEITLTHLGMRDEYTFASSGQPTSEGPNGVLDGSTDVKLGLWEPGANGALLAQATVPAGTTNIEAGVFYAALSTPLTLSPGSYVVSAMTTTGGEYYRSYPAGVTVPMAAGITFEQALADPDGTNNGAFRHPSGEFNGSVGGGAAWFGPTFKFTTGDDVPPPTGGGTAAVDNLALPNGVGEVGYSLNFALGWQFSTAEEITLTHLGMRDEYTFASSGQPTSEGPNGVLDGSTDVKLGLWEPGANGALLAQATVPAGTTNIEAGVFYAALSTPLTLSPGSYVVSAMTTTGGEYYRSYPAGVTVPMAPGITFEQALADPDGTNNGAFRHPSGEFNGSVGGGAAWFGPTFKFTTGDGGTPPTGGGTAAVDNLALPNGVGEVGYSLNFALGWQFSTTEEITLTHLGMRDEYTFASNGQPTSEGPNGVLDGSTDVRLGLWEPGAGGALLAQATVPAGTTNIEAGVFYAALSTPLTLLPGSYVVSAMTTTGGEYYRSYPAGVTVPMAPGITFEQALADPDGTNNGAFRHPSGEFNGSVGGGAAWFGPTFKFTSGDGVPNPGGEVGIDTPPIGGDGSPTGEVKARAVYQRNFDGTPVVVPLVINNGGAILEYRFYQSGTTPQGTWTSFDDETGSSSRANVSLTVGRYDFSIRNKSTGAEIQTIEKVGIGDVFVVAGQSNSENFGGQNPSQVVDDRISAYNLGSGEWVLASDPQTNKGAWNLNGGSPWSYFGNYYTQCTNVPIHVISVGWGSTRIEQWTPTHIGTPPGNGEGVVSTGLYVDRLQPAINQVKNYNGARAVFWHQGENDVQRGTSAQAYQSWLNSIISRSRLDIGDSTLPWFVALVSEISGEPESKRQPVLDGQIDTIIAGSNVTVGSQTDKFLKLPALISDGIHFSSIGLDEHAKEWFNALKRSGLVSEVNGCANLVKGYALPSGGLLQDANNDGFNDRLESFFTDPTDPVDTTPPIITFAPSVESVEVDLGEAVSYPAVSCSDDLDGDRPVTDTGTVSTAVAGEYARIYSCADSASNPAQKAFTVTVVDDNPNGGPLTGQLGVLDLSANGGINPVTGSVWQAGDQYRLAFVTSQTTQATSTDISSYNSFVQAAAAAAGHGGVNWRVIGSTASNAARDNTETNPSINGAGVAIFAMDGSSKIADNNNDLWDGDVDAHITFDENKASRLGSVFTGSSNDGTQSYDGRVLGGSNESPPKVMIANTTAPLVRWMVQFNSATTSSLPVYAMSEPLSVIVVDTTPPIITFAPSGETLQVNLGETVSYPLVSCSDAIDGDRPVTDNGPVSTAVAGEFTRIYSCVDNAGNPAQKAFTVTVVDDNPNGGPLTGQLGVLDLSANGGINPVTGSVWQAGDQYRLAFVTSQGTQATSTNIASYNAFVDGLADAAGYNSIDWRVIGSTNLVAARDNTLTDPAVYGTGVAIFAMDGTTKIVDNYSDLWDGSLDAHISFDENGNSKTGGVFGGSENNGSPRGSGRVLGGSTESPPKVTIGNTTAPLNRWMVQYNALTASTLPVYALSEVLTIGVASPLDEISPIVTLVPASLDIRIPLNGSFSEPTVTCIDDVDGVLPVSISNPVDATQVGTYNPVYSCQDQAGNLASSDSGAIKVEVFDDVDSTSPIIELDPPALELTILRGSRFIDYGVSCTDDQRDPPTLTISGSVNVNVIDVYSIIYTCTDDEGNQDIETLTVNVVETLTGDPLTPANGRLFFQGILRSPGQATGGNRLNDGDRDTTYTLTLDGVSAAPIWVGDLGQSYDIDDLNLIRPAGGSLFTVERFTIYVSDQDLTSNGLTESELEANSNYIERHEADQVFISGSLSGRYVYWLLRSPTTDNSMTLAEIEVYYDTTQPTLQLTPADDVTLIQGSPFIEPNQVCTDDKGTTTINTSGAVDTDRVGVYIIVYRCDDGFDNVDFASITVTVIPDPNENPDIYRVSYSDEATLSGITSRFSNFSDSFHCPTNKVIVDMAVGTSSSLSDPTDFEVFGVSFACATLNLDGSLTDIVEQHQITDASYPFMFGDEGQGIFPLPCTGVITGLRGNGNFSIERLGHHCSSIAQLADQVSDDNQGMPVPTNGSTSNPFSQRCEAGQVATGAQIYVDPGIVDQLENLQLICSGILKIPENDDLDGDGEPNSIDNCPAISNALQLDSDQDGVGDACDPDTPNNDIQVRTLRDLSTECHTDEAGEHHDCVNLAYRKPVAGVAQTDTQSSQRLWLEYAVDGFTGNSLDSVFTAKVALDPSQTTGNKNHRLTVDLGRAYDDIHEVEIVSHMINTANDVLVDICTGTNPANLSCIEDQKINGNASLIQAFASTGVTFRYMQLRSETSFSIDEILVLARDPFSNYRSSLPTSGSTEDDIATFADLVDAVEQHWGGDLQLNDAVTALGIQSHDITVTQLNQADAAGIDIDFTFNDSSGDVLAKLVTLESAEAVNELVLVADLPANKSTWSDLLGADLWPSADALDNSSKIIIPFNGATGESDDSGVFTILTKTTDVLGGELGITADTELSFERGVNLFTKLSSANLPAAVQAVTGNNDIVFFGGIGFTSFDWFDGGSWADSGVLSLTSIVPLDLTLGDGNAALDLNKAAARMTISDGELVLGLSVGGKVDIDGAGPDIRAGSQAMFSSDSSGLLFEVRLAQAWDVPFGFQDASIPSASIDYIHTANSDLFAARGTLEIGTTALDLSYNRTSFTTGSRSSSINLQIQEPNITHSALDSILESVSGTSAVTIPTWLNDIDIKDLSGTVSWSSEQSKNYYFIADVDVCVDFANYALVGTAECNGFTDVQELSTELEISYLNDEFIFSVEIDFDSSNAGGFAHELMPAGYDIDSALLAVTVGGQSAGARVRGTLIGNGSQGSAHDDVASITFSLEGVSGSSGSSAAGSFTYQMKNGRSINCDGLVDIVKTHHTSFSGHSGCDAGIPDENSGSVTNTGLAITRFSMEFNLVNTGGTTSYFAWVGADGLYTFANGSDDELNAFIGISSDAFAVGFDAEVAGNIAHLFGLGADLSESDTVDPTTQTESELSLLIVSSDALSNTDNSDLINRINAAIDDKPLQNIGTGNDLLLQVALTGQVPKKIVDHLHFLGIHENLELDMYLGLSYSQANFNIDVLTFNCEYDSSAAGCGNFADDSDVNEYPNWFKSAEVEVGFHLDRVQDEVDVFIGGDLVIHENENAKEAGSEEDIKLIALAGFESPLEEPAPEIFICAKLKKANPSESQAAPNGLVSSCSSTNSDPEAWFELHGIQKMEFNNLGFEIKITPVHIDLQASGGIRIEKDDSGSSHLEVDLDKLAFSINSETGLPLGGDVKVSTNATISSQEVIGLFNHHNGSDASDKNLQSNDTGGQHLFHDMRLVGLIDGELPVIGSEALASTELEIAFGDLGNRFTFSTGFQMMDSSSNYQDLGIVDLHLSLSQVHFYGELFLEPLLGSHFIGLKEQLRVDINDEQLEVSGTIEFPKPHLFGKLHLFRKHHKSFNETDCVTSGQTLNPTDNAFDALGKTKQNDDCRHENTSDNVLGKPQEIYSIRGNLKVNKDEVTAEAILDNLLCDLNGDDLNDANCELESEKSVSLGIRKVNILPAIGMSIDIPYIHVKSDYEPVPDSGLDAYASYFDQPLINGSFDAEGDGNTDFMYFSENTLKQLAYSISGDINGDRKADILTISGVVAGDNSSTPQIRYLLGTGTQWRTVPSELVQFENTNSTVTMSFPSLTGFEDVVNPSIEFSRIKSLGLHNVHPALGDELVMLLDTAMVICTGITSNQAACEVASILAGGASLYDRLVAMNLTGGDLKSLILPRTDDLAGPLNVSFNQQNGSWVTSNPGSGSTATFPASTDLEFAYVGKFRGADESKTTDKLLVFGTVSGGSFPWELWECTNVAASTSQCEIWSSTVLRKSHRDPKSFFFGDFDGDGWDDVLSIASNGVDKTYSSGATGYWRESDDINDLISNRQEIDHPESSSCNSSNPAIYQARISAGRGQESDSFVASPPVCID